MDSSKSDSKENVFNQVKENIPINISIVRKIRSLVLNGILLPGDQLPGEFELSRKLNVSRGALRDALQILEKTGFIIRRHGVGTFISENPMTSNNLNVNLGITQAIQASGAKPGTTEIVISSKECTKDEANHLNINVGDPIVELIRIRTANEMPVAFTIDQISQSFFELGSESVSLNMMREYFKENQSLLSFVQEKLQLQLHHAISSIKPLIASREIHGKTLAARLGIDDDSGILLIEQVEYLANGKPVIYVHEYHSANFFSFDLYRSY
jgi:GntR family transcriptional regulator